MNPRDPGRAEMRIGDEEREAAVSALGVHYAAGRLTKEEYDERAERAFAARTHAQLLPLFADLPRPVAAPGAARAAGAPSPDPRRGHPDWWSGTWMVPVLAVVAGLVILTHLPLFLLVLVAWFVLARMGRRWGRGGCGHGYGAHDRGYRRGQWVR